MIVFTHSTELVNAMGVKFYDKQMIVMNLSSYHSGYFDITPLITNISIINNTQMPAYEFIDSIEFDYQYAYAIQNNIVMQECVLQMVNASYEGAIVVILVHRDQYRDAVMESLIKYIQQRYGHKCWIAEDFEDIINLRDEGFSEEGISVLDIDVAAYNELYQNGYAQNPLGYQISIE